MNKQRKRLFLLRILLGLLILANMGAIFFFSAQSGSDSGKTSSSVTEILAQMAVPSFDSMSDDEQAHIRETLHPFVRKFAHMAEFGSLAALVFLFLLTFGGSSLFPYAGAILFSFVYACTDEFHQLFSSGRGASLFDVLIDLSGALIASTLLLGILLLLRRRGKALFTQPTTVTHYRLPNLNHLPVKRIALASDLHRAKAAPALTLLEQEKPDLILIPGDLMGEKRLAEADSEGYAFLRGCAKLAPTFYSLGNHEISCTRSGSGKRIREPRPLSDEIRERIRETGAILLDNESILHGGMRICGLTSGIRGKENRPKEQVLAAFASAKEPRLLLCHHPEYYAPYVARTTIELTVCGHAHGGHWRLFGRGIYAPGQGLFPKYTSGVQDGRCVISRGMGDHTGIPRIGNLPEVVILHLDTPVS